MTHIARPTCFLDLSENIGIASPRAASSAQSLKEKSHPDVNRPRCGGGWWKLVPLLGVNYEADSWLHFGRHFEEGRRRYRVRRQNRVTNVRTGRRKRRDDSGNGNVSSKLLITINHRATRVTNSRRRGITAPLSLSLSIPPSRLLSPRGNLRCFTSRTLLLRLLE